MKPDRQLPDDLARLGCYLEVAAGETLRRRQRRQAMTNFVGVVMLSVPFALAVAAADLAPADGLVPNGPQPLSFDIQTPATAFMVRHVPSPTKERCFDAQVCRPPLKPTVQPARAGKR
jgi:hypothetical protein